MTSTGMSAALFTGIDVSQARLDVGLWPDGKSFHDSNDAEGRSRLAKRLAALKPKLVVLESTGRLEVPFALELGEHGVPYRIVNPRQVREFARAMGTLAKTDRIDAWMLARYAESSQLAPKPLPEASRRELRALVMRRLQLIETKVTEENRLTGETVPRVLKSQKASIAWLEKQIAQLDDGLKRTTQSNPDFATPDVIIQSVPGVGPNTSNMLIACVPELGTLTREQAAR